MKKPSEKPIDKLLPHLPAIAKDLAQTLEGHAGAPVGFGLVILKGGFCHLIANTGNSRRDTGALRAALKAALRTLPKPARKPGRQPGRKPERKLH